MLSMILLHFGHLSRAITWDFDYSLSVLRTPWLSLAFKVLWARLSLGDGIDSWRLTTRSMTPLTSHGIRVLQRERKSHAHGQYGMTGSEKPLQIVYMSRFPWLSESERLQSTCSSSENEPRLPRSIAAQSLPVAPCTGPGLQPPTKPWWCFTGSAALRSNERCPSPFCHGGNRHAHSRHAARLASARQAVVG
jgi:hypothetical protein